MSSTTATPGVGARGGLGVALVVLSATLFIVNSGVSRIALRNGIAADELTVLRVTGTCVVLALAAALWQREALRPPRGRDLVVVVSLGAVGVALLQWLYFVAIDRLTIGLALLLEYQAPFLVALWAKFVQRSPVSARLWWGLGLAVTGLAMATQVWAGASFDGIGVAAGCGAAVCFAAYFLLGEQGQRTMSSLRLMLWSFAVGAVLLNVVTPLWGIDAAYGSSVSLQGSLAHLSVPLWTAVAWIVVMGTLLPFGLGLVAMRFIPPTLVTAIAMLEPIGASALGWAWYGESLGAVAITGCVVVVVGIMLAQSARQSHPDDPVALT